MFETRDYEAVLQTIYSISSIDTKQSKGAFKEQVLALLSEGLQYHHTVFWDIKKGELEETPTVREINNYTLTNYLSTYKYYDPLHPVNMQNQPTVQLLTAHQSIPETKKRYYQDTFLKQADYKDQMVMYLKDGEQAIAAIGLLRHRQEEVFKPKDVMALTYIHKVLENIYLLREKNTQHDLSYITAREEELLRYVCKGYKNHEIARQLFVSENTVKKHLQNLYRKCNVANRTQLALIYSDFYKN